MRFRRLAPALEQQLEVEKLHQQEIAANKGSEFDVLYDATQKNIATAQSNQANQDETDTETGSEGDAVDDVAAPSEDEALAMEEIRNLTYASEEYATFTHGFKETSMLLGTLGITFTVGIVTALFKGVIYAFCKIARLMYVSSYMLKRYMERRSGAFENIKSNIATLRKSIDAIKESGETPDLEGQKYTQTKVINTLKIGNSVEFSKNVEVLRRFMADTVRHISDQIHHETSAVQHIASSALRDAASLPTKLMNIDAQGVGLTQGVVQGYEPTSEYVTAYHSTELLPSDVRLIATFPRDDLTDYDSIAKGYNDSSMVLGFDTSTFQDIDSVDYMTIESLLGFLDELEQLCDTCIEHEAVYERIKNNRQVLKNTIKNFFSGLSNKTHKVSLRNSFVDYVYLKTMFVDKVYLMSVIDIHDYASKVLVAGTSMAKENISRMT